MRSHDEEMTHAADGLEPVAAAVARSAEEMPFAARTAVRERLLAGITPVAVPLHVRVLRPAIALAAAGALLGGVSYAAAGSQPGQPLFALKQSVAATMRSAQHALNGRGSSQKALAPAPGTAPAHDPLEAPVRKPAAQPPIPQIREAAPASASVPAPKAPVTTKTAPGRSKPKAHGGGTKSNGKGAGTSKPKSSKGVLHQQAHPEVHGSER